MVGMYVFDYRKCLTLCSSGQWAGVDSAWEQYKLEARKIFEKPHRTYLAMYALLGGFLPNMT